MCRTSVQLCSCHCSVYRAAISTLCRLLRALLCSLTRCLLQLLENANEFIIHGYAYRDWIREIPHAQDNVGKYSPEGGIDLTLAMHTVYKEARDFLLQVYPALTENDVSLARLLDPE